MSFDLSEFIAIVAANSIVVFLARNWFLERLRQSIKSEYDTKLEKLKANLASDNSTKLEQLKARATMELEETRNALQKEIEEYRVSASSSIGAIQNLSASIQQMVQCFTGIYDFYSESIFTDDEARLERCGNSLRKASKDFDHALLSISDQLEMKIRSLIDSYGNEYDAFAHCLKIKKIRAGLIKSNYDTNEYNPQLARETAKEIVPKLECEWHAVKNKLRDIVSGRREEQA
jgi:hypothetical protein